MGDYANDLIIGSIMSEGLENSEPMIWIPIEADFEVSIIHRKTRETHWVGTVKASSKIDAQREFRKKYMDIKNQYSNEYGLGIRLL